MPSMFLKISRLISGPPLEGVAARYDQGEVKWWELVVCFRRQVRRQWGRLKNIKLSQAYLTMVIIAGCEVNVFLILSSGSRLEPRQPADPPVWRSNKNIKESQADNWEIQAGQMVELKPNSAVCHCISVNLSKAKATCIYRVLLCPVTKLNITNICIRQYISIYMVCQAHNC